MIYDNELDSYIPGCVVLFLCCLSDEISFDLISKFKEAYSTPILPLDILAERPPEKKFEWVSKFHVIPLSVIVFGSSAISSILINFILVFFFAKSC